MHNYPQPNITESAANEYFPKGKVGIGFTTTVSWYSKQLYAAFPSREPKIFHKPCGEFEAIGNRHIQSGVLPTMEMAVKQIGIKQLFASYMLYLPTEEELRRELERELRLIAETQIERED